MKSEKAGKCLIVGNHPLDLPELEETITISESHFKPDRCPSYEEMIPLTESEEYQKRKPLAWDQPDVKEIEFYRKGFGRYSMNEPFNFKKILQFHSANHANFIDPKYFVTQDGNPFPYSIADSVHTCSSCLEFFSILGKQWTTKYVIPCIGAVQFAKLPMDQYFEVTKLKRKEEGDGPHHTGTI